MTDRINDKRIIIILICIIKHIWKEFSNEQVQYNDESFICGLEKLTILCPI